jgi:hypothetical protein
MTIDMLCASAVVCGRVRLVVNRERSIRSSLGDNCGPTIALFLWDSERITKRLSLLVTSRGACDYAIVGGTGSM